MVIKSLILGVIFTLGIFAVKSGIGLFYALKSGGDRKKTAVVCFLSYSAVFTISYFIIVKINLLNYFQFFQSFLKSAMWSHILLATGMIWWGLNVLLNKAENTKAYLMLVLPCPFCSLSIFLALSFFVEYTGRYSFYPMLILFFAFTLMQIITLVLLKLFKVKNIRDFLGFTLIFTGIYFIITFCTAPVFSDIGRIYRLSAYSSDLHFLIAKKYLYSYLCFTILIFSGFIFRQLHKRKVNVK